MGVLTNERAVSSGTSIAIELQYSTVDQPHRQLLTHFKFINVSVYQYYQSPIFV